VINRIRSSSLALVIFIHAYIFLYSYVGVDHVPTAFSIFYGYFFAYFHPASLLAAISGYLFFKGYSVKHTKEVTFQRNKYLKRIQSIIVPYLFWVTLFFVVNNFIIAFFGKQGGHVFANAHQPLTVMHYLKALIYPELAVAKHLWYLNNLLLVFALTPVFLMVFKRLWLFIAVFLVLVIYYYAAFTTVAAESDHILKFRFIIFYFVGGLMGMQKMWLEKLILHKHRIGWTCVLLTACTFIPGLDTNYGFKYLLNSITVPVLVFYPVYWVISKAGEKDFMYSRSEHFLLYILHPLLLSLVGKLIQLSGLLHQPPFWAFILLTICLTALLIIGIKYLYRILHRFFPWFTQKLL